jgi:ParB/RepB/Spo0J family partition protein
MSEYNRVPVNKIMLPEVLVRQEIDPDHVSELANSMARHGLIEPIVVSHTEAGEWKLIAGCHRLAAAKQLQWELIPAVVRVGVDEKTSYALAAIENVARKQMTIQEECAAVAHMTETEHLSVSQICGLMGKSRAWIEKRLMAPNLPEKVRAALFEGRIGVGAAEIIGGIENEGARNSVLNEAIYAQRTNSELKEQARMWASATNLDDAIAAAGEAAIEQQAPQERLQNCALCSTPRSMDQLRPIIVCNHQCVQIVVPQQQEETCS